MIRCGALLALASARSSRGASPRSRRKSRANVSNEPDALLEDRAGWDEAITLYRALLAESPEWTEPRLGLARVLAWRGDYAESLEHYERVAASPSAPPDLAIERAEVLSWAGRNDEARVLFEEALAQQPGRSARRARPRPHLPVEWPAHQGERLVHPRARAGGRRRGAPGIRRAARRAEEADRCGRVRVLRLREVLLHPDRRRRVARLGLRHPDLRVHRRRLHRARSRLR